MQRMASSVAIFFLVVGGNATSAHESRPLYVEVVEQAPNTFAVTWKIPPSALSVTSPAVVMPKICTNSTPPVGTQLVKRQLFRCKSDLSGEQILIDFPRYNPSLSTLFRFQRLSGEKHTAIRSPRDPAWRIPDRENTLSVAKEYLALGIEHILKGYDHLLFVACLVVIAGTWRRILITVTGFTIAHSVTLALAALNLVHLPGPPAEAAIALSVLFLATEIARVRRDTLTWRHPIAVAGLFGLLHGFGFASVLNEIGLPQIEIPTALLFFNVGVEVGQILFVVPLVGMAAGLATLGLIQPKTDFDEGNDSPPRFARPAAYLVGPLAAYWMIDRIVGFVV